MQLNSWIRSETRKPLILRGARQVGKSTAVRLFAKEQGLDLYEINLERHKALERDFATFHMATIKRALENVWERHLTVGATSLLFLDEIQATPSAIAALRYFLEDMPQLPVIAAGSLLELVLGQTSISMPVGRVQYLHMGPLSFLEFVRAKGETWFAAQLANYQLNGPWSEALHEKGLHLLREFLFVGGMPEAVDHYLRFPDDSRTWLSSLQNVVDTYKDDFAKYTHREALLPVLQQVYERLPRRIGSKVVYANLAPGMRHSYIHDAVDLLNKAKVIHLAKHTDATGIPLEAEVRDQLQKVFWIDCGLLNRLLRLDDSLINQPFAMAHQGPLAEQFVAQHLAWWEGEQVNPSLFYWLREGKKGNAEVDFLVQLQHLIVPLEVKSGATGTLRSLMQFLAHGQSPLGLRLCLDRPLLQPIQQDVLQGKVKTRVTAELLSLPLYMIGELRRLSLQALHRALG